MYTVFKYASPSNKAATGPWQRFGKMIRAKPYGVLVGHDRAEVLLEWKESGRESYKCLVRVWSSSYNYSISTNTPTISQRNSDGSATNLSYSRIQKEESATVSKPQNRNVCVEFYWILSKCDEREDSLFKGCWMVDGVFPR